MKWVCTRSQNIFPFCSLPTMGSWVMASHDLQSCSSSLLDQFLPFFRTFGEATAEDEVEDEIMTLGVLGSGALEDDIAVESLCVCIKMTNVCAYRVAS